MRPRMRPNTRTVPGRPRSRRPPGILEQTAVTRGADPSRPGVIRPLPGSGESGSEGSRGKEGSWKTVMGYLPCRPTNQIVTGRPRLPQWRSFPKRRASACERTPARQQTRVWLATRRNCTSNGRPFSLRLSMILADLSPPAPNSSARQSPRSWPAPRSANSGCAASGIAMALTPRACATPCGAIATCLTDSSACSCRDGPPGVTVPGEPGWRATALLRRAPPRDSCAHQPKRPLASERYPPNCALWAICKAQGSRRLP
jgi:hypothetical protein